MKNATQVELGRDNQLDGLRGLAALVVVVSHGILAFDFAFYTGQPEHSLVAWDIYLSGAPFLLPMLGNLAVCVFFLMSGYVLSLSFSKTHLGVIALFIKRYTRLVLPILTVCLISYALLAAGFMKNSNLAVISKSIWLAGQMQQEPSLALAFKEGVFGAVFLNAATYDGALWTMSIEMWGSVLLIAVFGITHALKFEVGQRKMRCQIAVFLMLAIVGFNSYLSLFALGALLSLTQIHKRVGSGLGFVLLLVGLFLGSIPYSAAPWDIVRPFVALAIPATPGMPYPHSAISFVHAIGAVFILVAAQAFTPFRRMLSTRLFQFLGEISFPLYLIHLPLLLSVVCAVALAMLKGGLSYALTMMLSIVLLLTVSIVAAVALLVVCERPSIVMSKQAGLAVEVSKRKVRFYLTKVFCRSAT